MALFSRKRGCSCLPGCLLTLVLLAGGAWLWFQHAAPPPAPAPVVRRYSPAETRTARRHVEEMRDVFLRPAPPAVPGKKQSNLVRVQISEADLNAFLSTNPALQAKLRERGVQALQVMLHAPQGVDVRAAVLVRGQTQNVRVLGDLLPGDPDGVRLRLVSAQAGRVALPLKFITPRADKIMAQLTGRLPVQVRRVQIVKNTLVLSGVRR